MDKTEIMLNNFYHCFETLRRFIFFFNIVIEDSWHIMCIHKYVEQGQTLAWDPRTIKQKLNNKVKMKLDIQVLTGTSEFIERSAAPFLQKQQYDKNSNFLAVAAMQ